jgi:CBS-domain-containing membrane protein
MHEPTARDLMIPLDAYPHVREADTLLDAINIMAASHIERNGSISLPRSLLVFDDAGHLSGMVRRRDLLRGISPRFFFRYSTSHPEAHEDVNMDLALSEIIGDKIVNRFREKSKGPVSDVMQPIPAIIEANANLAGLIHSLVEHDHHMLPVIEADEVIGIVRSVEILAAARDFLSSLGTDG